MLLPVLQVLDLVEARIMARPAHEYLGLKEAKRLVFAFRD